MKTFWMMAACAGALWGARAGEVEEAALAASLPEVFAKSAAHYRALEAAATPLMKDAKGVCRTPHGWKAKDDALDMRDIYWWTSGHFPGSLWYLYEATGDEFFKTRATVWTEILAPVADYTGNHDIGFMIYCSYGNARRLLKTDKYDALLVRAAGSLCTRFNDKLGLIRSWGSVTDTKKFLVIPDNLMNLELLECASRISGEARYAQVARSHATKTMAHHFRADGGTYHVLDYCQADGRVQGVARGQGANCETAWSRGQSWAIYGYTMMFRETKDRAYLNFAMKTADYAIGHPNMPADGVPYWDYGAPGEERDTSAAAIMASGLLELSTLAPAAQAPVYRAFAVKQLTALASPAYYAAAGENGDFLLKHGVGHKPANSEVDVPLDYGDYYFLEALLRFKALRARPAEAKPCCRAFYAPYRMDDFCWENDCLAMRAYGPVIMEPPPKGQKLVSSGFDVFNKCVDYPVLEKWLHMGSEVSYHKDHGEGMDNYKVGPSRGCGGVGCLTPAGWVYEKNWKKSRVLSEKPEEAVFELEYEACTIKGTIVKGCPFVKFEVRPNPGVARAAEAWIGPGLDVSKKRQHDGVIRIGTGANGYVANWEPEGVDGQKGCIGTAIVLKGKGRLVSDEMDCLHLLQKNETFVYWAGACWSGAGRFTSAAAWHAFVDAFAADK